MKNSTEESKKEFQIFDRIKRIRLLKGMSLREISQKAGLSENYLSQVENGKANPSIGTIKKITDALALPLIALLIGEENNKRSISQKSNRVKIVKANERKTLVYPGSLRKASLLTPDLQGMLEVIITVEEPEAENNEQWYSHEGEELGLILEGRYEVTVEDEVYKLDEGDSICFPSHLLHKMRNPGNKPSKTIWVITPPSF
jgi:transcriptional regulator with XRE-family HTH domain